MDSEACQDFSNIKTSIKWNISHSLRAKSFFFHDEHEPELVLFTEYS